MPKSVWADQIKDGHDEEVITETDNQDKGVHEQQETNADECLEEQEEALAKGYSSKKYALCVGINEYVLAGCGTLHGCVNDADFVGNFLLERGGWLQENVTFLHDKDANWKDVRDKIREIAGKAEPGDEFVLVWSSHGDNHRNQRDKYTNASALCTYDQNYEDYELAEDLMYFEDGVKVVILVDACHSGGLFKTDADPSDDNDKGLEADGQGFDLADRVSAIIDENTSKDELNARGTSPIKSENIGWAVAAQPYQYSYDSGYFDATDWFFTGKTSSGTKENKGAVFLAALILSGKYGWADTMLKGNGDGYIDAYEGWAYGNYVCEAWGYNPCCKNIEALRAVKLGWVGDYASELPNEIKLSNTEAHTIDLGDTATINISGENPEDENDTITIELIDSTADEGEYTFDNGKIEFTPKEAGYYSFKVNATSEANNKTTQRVIGVTANAATPVITGVTIDYNEFTVNWEAVNGADKYLIEVSDNGRFYEGAEEGEEDIVFSDIIDGGETSITCEDCYENCNYYFRMLSMSDVKNAVSYRGYGAYSKVEKIRTKKAEISKEPDGRDGLVYNGDYQELVVPGETEGAAFFYYAIGPCEDEPITDYNSIYDYLEMDIPSGGDAGKYWVYYIWFGNPKDYWYPCLIEVSIAPKTITSPTIELEEDFYPYDGKAKTPEVIVMDGDAVIPAEEYKVTYANNTAVGTATVKITDVEGGNYVVSGSKTFTIGGVKADWFWNDNGGAVAYFTSSGSDRYNASVKATVTNKITKQATVTTPGVKTYTGTVTYNGKVYTSTHDEPVYVFDKTFVGLQKYNNVLYYVKNGVQDTSFKGFAKYGNDWYYVADGKVDTSKKDIIKGTVNGTNAWWYVSGGKVQFVDSVEKNSNGWWVIRNGKVDFNYTGFAKNSNGTWYCKGGKVDFSKKDVIKGTVNGESGWWYVSGGKVQFVDSVEKNSNGWWVIKNGIVDFNFTGFAKNSNGWWYCKGGKVDFNKKDVIKGTVNGTNAWWYVSGGKVQFVDSIEKNSNGWWKITNGKVDFNYTGLAKNSNGWWYLKGGKVDFSYTGIAKNQYGEWYCKGGKVQFDYTGKVKIAGVNISIKGGKVVN